jgi:hypothetical protein
VITKIIEATNGPNNWGKFMVMQPTMERWHSSRVAPDMRVLRYCGWGPEHIIVFDLQTCEGAGFRPGGYARADLEKHKIWVCPMFEPFLEWLYQQDLTDINKLPDLIDLPNAPFAMSGYRRKGPQPEK